MKTLKILKPIRTEYSGIVFRSRTEAQFARALNVGGNDWEYEPQWLTGEDGQTPDFVVPSICDNRLVMRMMECKPSEPTETYKSELVRRAKSWIKILPCSSGLELFAASFYTMEFLAWYWNWTDEQWETWDFFEALNLSRSQLEEIKHTRFDLK